MGERIQLINPYPATAAPILRYQVDHARGSIGIITSEAAVTTTPGQHSGATIPPNDSYYPIKGPVQYADGPLASSGVQTPETSSRVTPAVDVKTFAETAHHPKVDTHA